METKSVTEVSAEDKAIWASTIPMGKRYALCTFLAAIICAWIATQDISTILKIELWIASGVTTVIGFGFLHTNRMVQKKYLRPETQGEQK